MDSLYNWNDATKIGVTLTVLGVFFSILGVFMLLDSVLLTMGNFLFVSGVALVMGPTRCRQFFLARPRPTACFFVGIVLVMFGWCFIGIMVQGFGGLNLFGNFFPVIARVLESMPVIGPILLSAPVQRGLSYIGAGNVRNRNV